MTIFFVLEIRHIRPGTSADIAGLRSGDRLVTVNEVLVVFLPVKDVMIALNMEELVANIEFERSVRQILIWSEHNCH